MIVNPVALALCKKNYEAKLAAEKAMSPDAKILQFIGRQAETLERLKDTLLKVRAALPESAANALALELINACIKAGG